MKLLKIAMLATSLLPLISQASLGGAPGTGPSASAMQRATPLSAGATTLPQTPDTPDTSGATPYFTHQSVDSNGVMVREYVLPTHVVFAVTWRGPVRPDMSALLGSYFPNFANAGKGPTRGTGPLVEHSGDFHIESAGRSGDFFGKAYLPRLVPANVIANDLQ
jgi:Protein of unknown function (DUF2844)